MQSDFFRAVTPALKRALHTAALGGTIVLLAGILEAWYRSTGEPASQRLPSFGYEFFFIAPAGLLLFCAPLLALVAGLRALWPARLTLARAAFLLAILPLAGLSLMVVREKMPDVVHLIIAMGLSAVIMRGVARRPVFVQRLVVWLFPVTLAVPAATTAALLWNRTGGEQARLQALPAAPARASNILLIVWDTVRERQLSLYGYHRPTTPHLEAHATTGIVFQRAYSTAPWTLPSHATMFTGLRRQTLELDWVTPLEPEPVTLAEVLAGAGYRTGGFTANLGATVRATGLARGFLHYEDWPITRRPRDILSHLTLVRTLRRYPPFHDYQSLHLAWKDAGKVTDSFLTWLDESGERPFFAFLNYFNAHGPYRAPAFWREQFPGDTAEARYDAAIAYQDAEFDRLMRALEVRGLRERTVIVLTSDHGEAFGDHGYWEHGGNLYIEQLHVPLILWTPQRSPAGLRVQQSVSLRDLAATLLDLGLPSGTPVPTLPGRSLARFWTQDGVPGDTAVAGAFQRVNAEPGLQITDGPANTVLTDRHHYILDGSGNELLFDLPTDPWETRDLHALDSMAAVRTTLRRFLETRWPDQLSKVSPPDTATSSLQHRSPR